MNTGGMDSTAASDGTIDAARLQSNWQAIMAHLDAPRGSFVERSLQRVGVPSEVVRVALATPALRRAWYVALALAALVGLGATNPDDPRQSLFTLLVLAPLVPVLGIALAYGPSADPAYEAQLATPVSGLRLLAVRSVTVLSVAVVVLLLVSLMSPVVRPMAAAWLLPAAALTSASVALMTRLPPRRSTSIIAVAWVVVASVARAGSTDGLGAFGPTAQLVALAATFACIGVIAMRRTHLDVMELRA